jgi:hypothetical protein
MDARTRRQRLRTFALVLLVVFTPVVLLVATVGVLLVAQSIDLATLSALELLELYLVELAVVVVFALVLYRLTGGAFEGARSGPDSTERTPTEESRRDEDRVGDERLT